MANEPDNNALNIQQRLYTNGAGKNVLVYVITNPTILITGFNMSSLFRL